MGKISYGTLLVPFLPLGLFSRVSWLKNAVPDRCHVTSKWSRAEQRQETRGTHAGGWEGGGGTRRRRMESCTCSDYFLSSSHSLLLLRIAWKFWVWRLNSSERMERTHIYMNTDMMKKEALQSGKRGTNLSWRLSLTEDVFYPKTLPAFMSNGSNPVLALTRGMQRLLLYSFFCCWRNYSKWVNRFTSQKKRFPSKAAEFFTSVRTLRIPSSQREDAFSMIDQRDQNDCMCDCLTNRWILRETRGRV